MESSASSGSAAQDGPVVIAFDGSPSALQAIDEAGRVLAGKPALVIVVWKSGMGFELIDTQTSVGLPVPPIDVRTALEVDKAEQESAQRLAHQGAELAHVAGFVADGLAVAEEPAISIAETICTVADERGAQAIVVGAHGHGRIGEMFLGSTSRDVIRRARQPVVVVRQSQR